MASRKNPPWATRPGIAWLTIAFVSFYPLMLDNLWAGQAAGADRPPAKASKDDPVVSELVSCGWDRDAAILVAALNRPWFDTIQDLAPAAFERQINHLCRLGQRKDKAAVFEFLKVHPETAPLLAGLGDDHLRKVLQSLKCPPSDFPILASLYQRNGTTGEAVALADALQDHQTQIILLTRRGIPGAETAFLPERTGLGGEAFHLWLGTCFKAEMAKSNEDLASFFQFVVVQGPILHQKLSEDGGFRKTFEDSWLKIARLREANHIALEFLADEPALWKLLETPPGERLLKDHGTLPATLLYGKDAYEVNLHAKVLDALDQKNALLVDSMVVMQKEPLFHQLLSRKIDSKMLETACTQLLATKDRETKLATLRRFKAWEDAALRRELEKSPEGIITWVPGYPFFVVGQKLYDDRDVTAWEWGDASLEAVSFLIPAGKGVKVVRGVAGGMKVAATSGTRAIVRKEVIQFASKRVGKEVVKHLSEKTAQRELSRWGTTYMLAEMQRVVEKQLPKLIALDITEPVRFTFTASRRLGAKRETFRLLTKLEARLFMRKDSRVVLYLGPNEIGNMAQKIASYFNDRAETTVAEFTADSSRETKAPPEPMARRPVPKFASDLDDLNWREQLSAWWLLAVTPEILDIPLPKR